MSYLESAHLVLSNYMNLEEIFEKKFFSIPEGDSRDEKSSHEEVQNKLVKNNQGSMLILGIIKLGSTFLARQDSNLTHLLSKKIVLNVKL